MPYKAAEVLAKLKRAGFKLNGSLVRMLCFVIRMEGKLMSLCIQKICQ